ncbi:MAG: 5'-methylthioadenosine/adenosylhomocysteine nucleosidase [Oscillospiraceae bacterium]|nr:5'-methylthioadenosine/adenosylhomocysteine nucleosidase [Oscillospiraceae bacterium]
MRIAVICAMEDEIKLLAQHMEKVQTLTECGVRVTRGNIAGHTVNLCIGGVGKANAAASAQYNISRFRCDMILNIGLAGSCAPLPLGGCVVADKLVYHDYEMRWAAMDPPYKEFFTPDEKLSACAARALEKLNKPYVRGTVATGDQFIESSAVKNDIVARTGCACVEMEGCAVAHIAEKNGVPFAAVKVMSDNADEQGDAQFHETMSLGGYCAESSEIIRAMLELL